MKYNTRKLIEYYGICKCDSNNIKNFTHLNKEYMFNIPACNHEIAQITKVWVNVSNVSKEDTEVIKTPCGKSVEGQVLTGNKLLVYGTINLKIEYISCSPQQNIYTASTQIPFCGAVVLPKEFNKDSYKKVTICVEDIFSKKLDNRNIYNNITMIIIVDIN